MTRETYQIGAGLSMQRPESVHTSSRLREDGLAALAETSRTFYIPISRLPSGLLEAVASAYLCLRAIDEIEDHPTLSPALKIDCLGRISQALQAGEAGRSWEDIWPETGLAAGDLPEVTRRWADWVQLAPAPIAARIWDATAAMADRMADWVARGWQVRDERDLDRYTFGVAGAVGLLLSDLWAWYDGTQTNRLEAIGFGRGLQAVNILRNHAEDLGRGVDFYPPGWTQAEMQGYARRNLAQADAYLNHLPAGPARDFCAIPLALAYATLDALTQGREKLARAEVMQVLVGLGLF